MTSTQVLVGGLAAALLWCGEAPAVPPLPQGDVSELDLARAALDQPGADYRLPRENAVKSLLSMTDQRAHIVLQDWLRTGDDPDGVSRFILSELGRRIADPGDGVFGIDAGDAGSMLLKSYVPALVSAFLQEGTDEQHWRLRDPALGCLLQMRPRARLEGLRATLAPGIQDLEMQKAALRAAASCRETGLARLLGEHLDPEDPLHAVAREGLNDLVFEDISTPEDFSAWWAQNGDRPYLDLVLNVARSADRVQDELNEKLKQAQVKWMEALVGQATVKWREIHDLVLADSPQGTMFACLARLAELLRSRAPDSSAAEPRLQFHTALLQHLASATNPEHKALFLETSAYLVQPQEQAEREAMEAVLVSELKSPYPPLRLAALRGLQRFPSPANRAAVVMVAKDALAGAGNADMSTLRVALETLHGASPSWYAPSPGDADYPDWISVLRQVFLRTDAPKLLDEGLLVAIRPDRSGNHPPEVFGMLVEVVKEPTIDLNSRARFMFQLGQFVTSENAKSYLVTILSLLDDGQPDIRSQAATVLLERDARSFDTDEEWDLEILHKVESRLSVEPREDVFQRLVDCLMGLKDGMPAQVIVALRTAMETLPEARSGHKEIVIRDLTQLGLDTELEVALWETAADALLDHEQRNSAIEILSKHKAGELKERASPEEDRRGLELLIRAAMLMPPGPIEDAAPEAQQALAAFTRLETDFGVSLDDPPHQLLRLHLYDLLADNNAIISRGSDFLRDQSQTLTAAQSDQVLILMAKANLRQDLPDDARFNMQRLSPAGSRTPAALAVSHQIGQRFMETEATVATAVDVLKDVVDNTRPEAEQYRMRFLDLAAATLKADPAKRTEVIRMLESKRALFTADDCPADLKERFRNLIQASGS